MPRSTWITRTAMCLHDVDAMSKDMMSCIVSVKQGLMSRMVMSGEIDYTDKETGATDEQLYCVIN